MGLLNFLSVSFVSLFASSLLLGNTATTEYRVPATISANCDSNVDLPKFKQRIEAVLVGYGRGVVTKIEAVAECLVYNDGAYCSGVNTHDAYCRQQAVLIDAMETFFRTKVKAPATLPHYLLSNIVAHRSLCGSTAGLSSLVTDAPSQRCEQIANHP